MFGNKVLRGTETRFLRKSFAKVVNISETAKFFTYFL